MASSSASNSPLGSVGEIPAYHMPSRSPSPFERPPSVFGLPLKYVSLITLAVQNALLTIIMHYSRVSTSASKAYSASVAVLLNELLKGSISFVIALYNLDKSKSSDFRSGPLYPTTPSLSQTCSLWLSRCRRIGKEVFSSDCWKLSIPAILYVIQNNLQYVAASNLDIATFQVTYQMKILTTAAFSVLLLRKKLSAGKWMALIALAVGVGIVQVQAGSAKQSSGSLSSSHQVAEMNPLKGFMAVSAACFTSGLAGVYFEMVLKNSQADLWVRNVQLSLFSILPAIAPILTESPITSSWFRDLFRNFGFWAWATVSIQVFGGLITAVVIKYSDNILKGFATSLSIIISFLASVILFHFTITPGFVLGASTVLGATWLYNQPYSKETGSGSASQSNGGRSSSFPGSPVEPDAPILGQYAMKKRSSLASVTQASPRALTTLFGCNPGRSSPDSAPYANGVVSDLKDASLFPYTSSRTSVHSSPPSPHEFLDDSHPGDVTH